MKTFKVFRHTDNCKAEEYEVTAESEHEVADNFLNMTRELVESAHPNIAEEYITATMSNKRSTGYTMSFSIFTSVLDYENKTHVQETVHYTIVKIS